MIDTGDLKIQWDFWKPKERHCPKLILCYMHHQYTLQLVNVFFSFFFLLTRHSELSVTFIFSFIFTCSVIKPVLYGVYIIGFIFDS